MPAPRTIVTRYDNPTALGRLAVATGEAQHFQQERDRYERKQARDMQFLASEMSRRSREAELRSEHARAMESLGVQRDAIAAATPVMDRRTFTNNMSPTRLQDAAMASAARATRSASTMRRPAMAPDPTRPNTGRGAVYGPQGATFSAGGAIMSSSEPASAQADYRAMMSASGAAPDPRMLSAMEMGPAGRGGFVGPGNPGTVPAHVAGQLATLEPYRNSMAPEDFAALSNAVRSGQVDSMDRLINNVEDAMERQARLDRPEQVRADPRFRTMSIQDHQEEVAMLRRYRAQTLMRASILGDVPDTSAVDQLIEHHQGEIDMIMNSRTAGGETGSGGPSNMGDTVVVSNGRETFRISRADLGEAQADGFREIR